jgi:hypothetical protein
MTLRIKFELEDSRDLAAWNATVLDAGDGGNVFVAAVMDRHGNRRLALAAGHGTPQVTMLDCADVLKLMDAIGWAAAAHGAPAGRVIW